MLHYGLFEQKEGGKKEMQETFICGFPTESQSSQAPRGLLWSIFGRILQFFMI